MLNHNTLLLIQTQEELNMLAEVTHNLALDCLHIDEDYVAYIDEVLVVVPLRDIDETHHMRGIKPTLFKKWIKKQKRG